MFDPCPCGLTKTVVLDLDARDRVQLIAGICQNPRADGSGALCGKALGAHPVQSKFTSIDVIRWYNYFLSFVLILTSWGSAG
jgi:hypothetical protein